MIGLLVLSPSGADSRHQGESGARGEHASTHFGEGAPQKRSLTPTTMATTSAVLRLMADLKAIKTEPPSGCSASPNSEENSAFPVAMGWSDSLLLWLCWDGAHSSAPPQSLSACLATPRSPQTAVPVRV